MDPADFLLTAIGGEVLVDCLTCSAMHPVSTLAAAITWAEAHADGDDCS